MPEITVRRLPIRIRTDPRRVVLRPWLPTDVPVPNGSKAQSDVFARILDLSDDEVTAILDEVRAIFAGRHHDLDEWLERHFAVVADRLPPEAEPSRERRLLIGAYCTREFAIEAAAVTNPSIVPALDQDDAPAGALRAILSLRAVGEGHISSIELRSATVYADGVLEIDSPGPYATTGVRTTPHYEKALFAQKLQEIGADVGIAAFVLGQLGDRFTMAELDRALGTLDGSRYSQAAAFETRRMMRWLASSNYVVTFNDEPVGARVLFPEGPYESRGMEDARFVRFTDDDGTVTHFATYTAWDGFNVLPQLIETPDFLSFRIATLNGSLVQNKGMALFPRRIGGRFAALSRHDHENLHLMTSDHVRFWDDAEPLIGPRRPWELVKIGNCGSPLETEAGWLVLTHGVGPMRRYTLGALLLDLDDPRKVLAHLAEPFLAPDADEREGYVPNVVYSCGGLIHAGKLVLPYGFSDVGTGFAVVDLDQLLAALNPA
jgi:predicted GH43/DUF377 family glycosyl hydrolase